MKLKRTDEMMSRMEILLLPPLYHAADHLASGCCFAFSSEAQQVELQRLGVRSG